MKKKILLLSLMTTAIGFAGLEANLKLGYDFLRSVNDAKNPTKVEQPVDSGLNLTLDLFPINVLNNRLEVGLGAQYSGGLFRLYPTIQKDNENTLTKDKETKTKVNYAYQVPLYLVSKVNIVNLEDGNTPLYLAGRLGYSFLGNHKDSKEEKLSGGVFVGLGLGTEYGPFVAELSYDSTLFKPNQKANTPATTTAENDGDWKAYHKIGLNLGYRFGQPTYSKPEIVEIPVVTPEPEVVPEVKPEPVPEVKPEVKPEGLVIRNVRTQKDTGLTRGEYTENNLPDLIYLKENDGYLYTAPNGNLYGSYGSTDAEKLFLTDNREVVLLDGDPLILIPVTKQLMEENELYIKKDSKGRSYLAKKDKPIEVKKEKTVLFPSHCSDEEKICIINGFAVDGRLPNDAEVEQVKAFVEVLNDYATSAVINIVGHTDSTGSDAYNNKLGLSRATNIAKLLQENGLKESIKIRAIDTKGESAPRATNATKDGRYLNRRVEIIFDEIEQQ